MATKDWFSLKASCTKEFPESRRGENGLTFFTIKNNTLNGESATGSEHIPSEIG